MDDEVERNAFVFCFLVFFFCGCFVLFYVVKKRSIVLPLESHRPLSLQLIPEGVTGEHPSEKMKNEFFPFSGKSQKTRKGRKCRF